MDPNDFAHQCVFSLNQFCMNHLPSSLISPDMNLEFDHLQSTQSLSLFDRACTPHFSHLVCSPIIFPFVFGHFSSPWLLQLGASLIFPCMVIPSSFSFMGCPQLGVSLPFSLWLFFISFQGALTFAQANLSSFQPSGLFFFFSQLRLGFPKFVRLNNLNQLERTLLLDCNVAWDSKAQERKGIYGSNSILFSRYPNCQGFLLILCLHHFLLLHPFFLVHFDSHFHFLFFLLFLFLPFSFSFSFLCFSLFFSFSMTLVGKRGIFFIYKSSSHPSIIQPQNLPLVQS